MSDMADWTTDNGLMPEDEWVVSARDNEYEREIRTLRKENKRLRSESEGRRKTLFEKSEEVRSEWTRAEKAEAEVDRLRKLVQEALRLYRDIEAEGSVEDTLRAALRGEGEK